jgi:hypothetical protein
VRRAEGELRKLLTELEKEEIEQSKLKRREEGVEMRLESWKVESSRSSSEFTGGLDALLQSETTVSHSLSYGWPVLGEEEPVPLFEEQKELEVTEFQHQNSADKNGGKEVGEKTPTATELKLLVFEALDRKVFQRKRSVGLKNASKILKRSNSQSPIKVSGRLKSRCTAILLLCYFPLRYLRFLLCGRLPVPSFLLPLLPSLLSFFSSANVISFHLSKSTWEEREATTRESLEKNLVNFGLEELLKWAVQIIEPLVGLKSESYQNRLLDINRLLGTEIEFLERCRNVQTSEADRTSKGRRFPKVLLLEFLLSFTILFLKPN